MAPEQVSQFLQEVTGWASARADILGLALVGSYARGTATAASDVDLISLRVWYREGLEIEYGLTDERWSAPPLDKGTHQVIADGVCVLFERGPILSHHLEGHQHAQG